MRLVLSAALMGTIVGASSSFANPLPTSTARAETVEHGGGCRKNSPPGKCCHMERRTGTVHCH